jgi:hypothetical protein
MSAEIFFFFFNFVFSFGCAVKKKREHLQMTSLQDLSDMSEVSVEFDDSRDGDSSAGGEDSGDEDSGNDSLASDEDAYKLDAAGRLSLLRKMKDRMSKSDLFDEEDLQAVDSEMARIVEREKNSLRAKMEERLRILTKFDKHLNMGRHHTPLNEYFVQKQMQMQSLAEDADEEDF